MIKDTKKIKPSSSDPAKSTDDEDFLLEPKGPKVKRTKPIKIKVQPLDFEKEFKCKLKNLLQIANQKRHKNVEMNIKKILNFIQANGRINNEDVRRLTGLKIERSRQYLLKLKNEGKIKKLGLKGPKVFYVPFKED